MIDRNTPGVHVTELPAFANPIVGVPTDIPIFIGYSAIRPAAAMVEVDSLADYLEIFGGKFAQTFRIAPATGAGDFTVAGSAYALKPSNGNFQLHDAVALFFANGGAHCRVVSCGDYSGGAIRRTALQDGLAVAAGTVGPSMVVVPDACLLGTDDYKALVQTILVQCTALQDRVAILDLPGAVDPANWSVDATMVLAQQFYEAVGGLSAGYSFGTAYHPALKTTLLDKTDGSRLDLADPQTLSVLAGLLGVAADAVPTALATASPIVGQIEAAILARINVAPASGALAGIWARTDGMGGVWQAPANTAPIAVSAPTVAFTDAEQAVLNAPLNGVAIDLLRSFPNYGVVVWGARTLDGNSDDFRYISVRRTLIYIEQSIKAGLAAYAFQANDALTWEAAKASIGRFLTDLWQAGGLMGAKASDAFAVECGLGSTMTGEDLLGGSMSVVVQMALVRPAEFIVLTFEQQMPGLNS